MKKTWSVLAALIGLFTVLGVAPAQAYPDTTPTVRLSVNKDVVVGGQHFTAKATADTSCTWTLTYLKQQATGSGTSISHSFGTPVVTKRTRTTVRATCGYDAAGTNRVVAASQPSTVSRTATVTLVPRDHGGQTSAPAGASTGGKHHGGQVEGSHTSAPGNPNTGGQSQGAAASHGGGLLPDTGGFAWWWLLIAALLVGGGAAAATRGRGDRTEH